MEETPSHAHLYGLLCTHVQSLEIVELVHLCNNLNRRDESAHVLLLKNEEGNTVGCGVGDVVGDADVGNAVGDKVCFEVGVDVGFGCGTLVQLSHLLVGKSKIKEMW